MICQNQINEEHSMTTLFTLLRRFDIEDISDRYYHTWYGVLRSKFCTIYKHNFKTVLLQLNQQNIVSQKVSIQLGVILQKRNLFDSI